MCKYIIHIQRRKHALGRAEYGAPTQTHELHHRDEESKPLKVLHHGVGIDGTCGDCTYHTNEAGLWRGLALRLGFWVGVLTAVRPKLTKKNASQGGRVGGWFTNTLEKIGPLTVSQSDPISQWSALALRLTHGLCHQIFSNKW